MEQNERPLVVVGMSGGVDSSVAAALLLEEGFRVIGITMKTYEYDEVGGNVENEASCCGLGAVNDARMAAAKLDIPHYVVDFRAEFGKTVIQNFVDEYLKGRTPNPCVICNREIKWGALLKKADALGAQFIATGHYARVRFDETTNRSILSRGLYAEKDQSYALWGISQNALKRTLFPLGGKKKPEVRALAEQFGLRNAQKQESFEICFVPDNRYDRFLTERVRNLSENVAGGEIVLDGKVVGKHQGYPFYTIGQRHNIGAFGKKMYVTGIDSRTNTLTIGPDKELYHRSLLAGQINWVALIGIERPMRVQAKVRYKDEAADAMIYPAGENKIRLIFQEPKRAVTPGQSVVFYDHDDVVGGGVIEEAGE